MTRHELTRQGIGMEKSQEEEDPTYMHQAGWGKEK